MKIPTDDKCIAWCPLCGDMLTHSVQNYKEEGWHYYCNGCDEEFKFVNLKEEARE